MHGSTARASLRWSSMVVWYGRLPREKQPLEKHREFVGQAGRPYIGAWRGRPPDAPTLARMGYGTGVQALVVNGGVVRVTAGPPWRRARFKN